MKVLRQSSYAQVSDFLLNLQTKFVVFFSFFFLRGRLSLIVEPIVQELFAWTIKKISSK